MLLIPKTNKLLKYLLELLSLWYSLCITDNCCKRFGWNCRKEWVYLVSLLLCFSWNLVGSFLWSLCIVQRFRRVSMVNKLTRSHLSSDLIVEKKIIWRLNYHTGLGKNFQKIVWDLITDFKCAILFFSIASGFLTEREYFFKPFFQI